MLKQINTRIEELFTNNYQKYYRLAYSYVQSPEDAMDVVQESAYKAVSYTHLDVYKRQALEFSIRWILL